MTINEIQEQVIEEFSIFDDWMDKYGYLIELGKELAPFNTADKNDKHLINGCQSRVWVAAQKQGDKVIYTADSDAIITKGIISLLIRILSNHTPEEILAADLYFIDKIGLKANLSPTRANGLVEMVKQMRMYALAFSTKNE